jgi:hypothetical protein
VQVQDGEPELQPQPTDPWPEQLQWPLEVQLPTHWPIADIQVHAKTREGKIKKKNTKSRRKRYFFIIR